MNQAKRSFQGQGRGANFKSGIAGGSDRCVGKKFKKTPAVQRDDSSFLDGKKWDRDNENLRFTLNSNRYVLLFIVSSDITYRILLGN
jgi:hypothetical protein